MTAMTSILTAARCTLEGGTKESLPNLLILRFGVELPATSHLEDWGGDLAFDRRALAGFANWLANQHRAFALGNALGSYNHRGLQLVPKVRKQGAQRQLMLTLHASQFLARPKAVQRGNPAQWPDWALPLAEVQGVVKGLMANPNPPLPDEG